MEVGVETFSLILRNKKSNLFEPKLQKNKPEQKG